MSKLSQETQYLASIVSETLGKCICRNISCALGKRSLHSRWNVSRLSLSLHVHGDEWKWRPIRISAVSFTSGGVYVLFYLSSGGQERRKTSEQQCKHRRSRRTSQVHPAGRQNEITSSWKETQPKPNPQLQSPDTWQSGQHGTWGSVGMSSRM